MSQRDPPIVIACQTNHALDQLLRLVAVFEPEYCRIGGRSADKVIKTRTLFALREESSATIPRSRPPHEWNILVKRIAEKLEPLTAKADVPDPTLFLKYDILTQDQLDLLKENAETWVTAGMPANNTNSIKSWLGSQLTEVKPRGPLYFGFKEYEDIEQDFEEVLENEAEQITRDEEDEMERLKGEYISIRDTWTGKGSHKMKKLESRLQNEKDLWTFKPQERGAIYRHMMSKLKEGITKDLQKQFSHYKDLVHERKIRKCEVDECVLRNQRVVGLTTTGLAKYRGLIASVRPKICIIEEAAETLEAPVTTACVESLEHLILVGDHKQLRPHCHVRELEAEPYNFGISLFERLVMNNVEFSRLALQRRMRPDISRVLKPIYGNEVVDHDDVKDLEDVPGMGVSCFFMTHSFLEGKDEELSTFNIKEAELITGFIQYLVYNGVHASQITVLTFYNGQRKKIKKLLQKDSRSKECQDINLKTVDSYQGEENDIVILSLVRNNADNSIGFLSVDNRVCVALSRAKRGFYMFGNAELLSRESKTWSEVSELLLEVSGPRQLGFHLPLTCKKHGRKSWIKGDDDLIVLSLCLLTEFCRSQRMEIKRRRLSAAM